MTTDFYRRLGVARDVSDEDLKRAYRQRARDLHPDRNPDDPEAEARFKEVTLAYEVLRHPERRRLYDEFGEASLRDGFDPDVARRGRPSSRASGARAGPAPAREPGAARTVVNEAPPREPSSHTGSFLDVLGRLVERSDRRGPDVEAAVEIGFAESLHGTQRDIRYRIPGAGRAAHTVRVQIPAGIADGGCVRLAGYGGTRRGRDPGDLVVAVRVAEHDRYWRTGNDLHVKLELRAHEAYAGTQLEVGTVDGSVRVRVPAGTRSGAVLRVRGKGTGLPHEARGDLHVHLDLVLPPPGDPRVREVLEQLAPTYPARDKISL